MDMEWLNGIAGIAALVNSMIMWPQLKAIRTSLEHLKGLEPRVTALEEEKKEREARNKAIAAKLRRPRGAAGVL